MNSHPSVYTPPGARIGIFTDEAELRRRAVLYVSQLPDLRAFAVEAAQHVLKKLLGRAADPEKIYWHRFGDAFTSHRSFTGWAHQGTPVQTMTFVELLIHRFSSRDQEAPDELALYGGFYTDGAGQTSFDERNEVRLLPRDVVREFWALDFSSKYLARVEHFWHRYGDDFELLAKARFLSEALRARAQGILDEDDFSRVTRAVIGVLSSPMTLSQLQGAPLVEPGVSVRTLDLGGHRASGMFRIVRGTRQILYSPGLSPSFQVIENAEDARGWVRRHTATVQAQAAFQALFGQGVGANDHLNLLDQPIEGGVFAFARQAAQQEMSRQAAALTSNATLRKQAWQSYLGAFIRVFGGLTVLAWPLALVAIGAGIAKVGLDIDQAANGRTAAQRQAGVMAAIFDSLFVLFNAPLLAGVRLPEIDVAPAAPAQPEQAGVLLAPGEWPMIELDGVRYPVRYLAASRQWFVIDPDNPFAFYGGRPVFLDPERGLWQVGEQLRLAGGMEAAALVEGNALPAPSPNEFWEVYMRAEPRELARLSRNALQRQRECLQHLPVAEDAAIDSDNQYVDDLGERHRIYQDFSGDFVSHSIRDYTTESGPYNRVLRLEALDESVAASVERVIRLADELEHIGTSNQVDLFRAGSGQRGTSGGFFRSGKIAVGDLLVNSDITSFTENPYVPVRFASSNLAGGSAIPGLPILFDDTSVVFILRRGDYSGAYPILPFSEVWDEAESLMLPGHYFKVQSFGEVAGEGYRFIQVDLKEVPTRLPGQNVFDLRTGEPFSLQAHAAKMHPGAKPLVDRFFAR